jgi:hypothetical protein
MGTGIERKVSLWLPLSLFGLVFFTLTSLMNLQSYMPSWPSQAMAPLMPYVNMINETESLVVAALGGFFAKELKLQIPKDDGSSNLTENPPEPSDKAALVETGPRIMLVDEQHPSPFCVSWDVQTDDWWTQHPQWEVSNQNDTHFCFQLMKNQTKVDQILKLYSIQFLSDCSNTTTRNTTGVYKEMVSSGWASDWSDVMDGLEFAFNTLRPFSVFKRGQWHYAFDIQHDVSACERKDPFCYFLNITSCHNKDELELRRNKITPYRVSHDETRFNWLYEYATRPQQWLRREVYEFIRDKSVKLIEPCTVIHVRRADVVLHGRQSRRYHEIQEYIDAVENVTQVNHTNIFLLTDDQNAIDEAKAIYPNKHWMYLDRPRYRGAEGGFEKQIPSKNPKFEVIVLLSTLEMIQKCSTFVHSTSSFASLMKNHMEAATFVNIDHGVEIIFHREHMGTKEISGRAVTNASFSTQPTVQLSSKSADSAVAKKKGKFF